MNLQNVNYVRIDENGDMIDAVYVSNENIHYIMKETWDFTEEEVRAKGYAPVYDSIRNYVNGDSHIDIVPGDIIKNADGTFTQEWVENPIDILEKRFRFMERKRLNELLSSDWTQLPDTPLSDADKAAWSTYRQQLRDLPDTIDWDTISHESEIEWPLIPGVVIPDPGPDPDPGTDLGPDPTIEE